MEEQNVEKTNAGIGLGIAGLVVGIISIPVAFIPCFSWYPIVIAIVGLVLSIIGFVQANNNNGKKGLIVAALVVSIVGTVLSTSWYFLVSSKVDDLIEMGKEEIQNNLDDAMKDLQNSMDSMNTDLQQDLNSLQQELDSTQTK